jgi:hypothetical protein
MKQILVLRKRVRDNSNKHRDFSEKVQADRPETGEVGGSEWGAVKSEQFGARGPL